MQEAKPFLKWAGGKRQLLPALEASFPPELFHRKDITYIEPFAGSGAVMFWLLRKNPGIEKAIINDVNSRLVQAYEVIKHDVKKLIKALTTLQKKYYSLSEDERREFFMEQRALFNAGQSDSIKTTVLLIFLNRTCFNGLYRVNRKNEFNVPFGRYAQPRICDEETLLADSVLLQKVTILNGDYADTLAHVKGKGFFYLDPPYKPLSKTSSFNAYDGSVFDDAAQMRLRDFCMALDKKKHLWLLSNSDPSAQGDNFFHDAYAGEGIYITKTDARRSINSAGEKRQAIKELLITNYPPGSDPF